MELVAKDIRDHISNLVDVMSLQVADRNKLNDAEKLYFAETVLAFWDGVRLGSKEFVDRMSAIFGWKSTSKTAYRFRLSLKRKEWLQKKKQDFILPPQFVKPLRNEINVKVRINLESDEDINRQDN